MEYLLGVLLPFLAETEESSTEHFALLSDFAIVMAVGGGAVVLFRFFRLPPILGYLLGGLLIGPYTLPSPPVENVELISALADLGLIILLFSLGVDLGWKRLRSVGVRVLVIGVLEISLMMALGYEIGTLLGWTGQESIFLGAAMSITSTAIIYKMLRDTGQLHQAQGRIIIGILVIEDFAAVILLTVLSGVAATGTADAAAVGSLALKLVIFAFAALVVGTLVAPGVIRFISRYKSNEILLLASLAMCFGLALIAQELSVSPAAGAFLVGTVLGDTEQSKKLLGLVEPVKDFFAALFFISIGMLVDLSNIVDHIWPALIVSGVFIAGKLLADTVGTFVTGEDGRTSLKVGTGMTQIGEFSLAIVKTGDVHGAVGTFLYPVVTVATGITSLLYPFIYRSADPVSNQLGKRAPRVMRQYLSNITEWIREIRNLLQLRSEGALKVKRYMRVTLLNVGVIILLLIGGSVILRFGSDVAELLHIKEEFVGLAVGGAVFALALPASIGTWWSLRKLTDSIAQYLAGDRLPARSVYRRGVGMILRDSLLLLLMVVLFLWSLPFLSHLFFLGSIVAPIPITVLVIVSIGGFIVSFKVYRTISRGLSRTFLPETETPEPDKKDTEA